MSYGLTQRVCCTCGKLFCPATMHKYKRKWRRKVYIACSYSCFVKLEKSIELEKEKAKHSKLSTK